MNKGKGNIPQMQVGGREDLLFFPPDATKILLLFLGEAAGRRNKYVSGTNSTYLWKYIR